MEIAHAGARPGGRARIARFLVGVALLGLAASWGAAHAAQAQQATPKVVYGEDDRREVAGLTGPRAVAANGTVALVSSSRIASNGDGTSRLRAPSLASAQNVCPSERFANQPTAAFCSGVLVGPDVVATAGHCVREASDLPGTRFVFGYRVASDGKVRSTIPNRDIYTGSKILARQDNLQGADFALIRLTRRVSNRRPLPLKARGRPAVGTPLYVIGHPSGLPAKFADRAEVLAAKSAFFKANLDTFGGNSGSPVFDARGNTVLGVLVRGEGDYVERNGCYVANVLADSAGAEEVTNASAFAPFVPQR